MLWRIIALVLILVYSITPYSSRKRLGTVASMPGFQTISVRGVVKEIVRRGDGVEEIIEVARDEPDRTGGATPAVLGYHGTRDGNRRVTLHASRVDRNSSMRVLRSVEKGKRP